jgi:hypothetical protein
LDNGDLVLLERIRSNLIDYAVATNHGYKVTRFHRMLAGILQNAYEGKYGRKMVLIHAHPRLGKSKLISETFPAWALGKRPDLKCIIASNSEDLASQFTLALREKVENPIHKLAFGEAATLGQRARADSFLLQGGGSILATSMNSTIVGKGANLLLIDDPITKRSDVETESYRNHIWTKFLELYTRMDSGLKICIILQQRWHKQDLIGRLLTEFPNDVIHFRFPALIETEEDMERDSMGRQIGEVVAPELFNLEDILHIKKIQSAEAWAAMYQGRPLNEDGGRFLASYVKRVNIDPQWASDNMTTYLIGDPASAKNATSDYSAFFVIGLNHDGTYWILDGVRERLGLKERWEKYRDLWRKWRPLECWYESFGASADLEYFKERMEHEKTFFTVQNSAYLNHSGRKRADGDPDQKHVRIERLIPDMVEGKWFAASEIKRVRLREDGTDVEYDPVSEMIADEFPDYPKAKHDDCLDAISRIKELSVVWPNQQQAASSKSIRPYASPW